MRVNARMAAATLVAVVACQGGAETPEQTAARIEQETAAFRTWIDAAQPRYEQFEGAGNVDSTSAFYMEDATAAFPNQPALKGRDAIHASATAFQAMGKITLDINTVNAMANGPLAVEHGTFVQGLTPAPTTPKEVAAMFPDSGNYMAHWHKVNGEWKIAQLIVTSQRAMPGMPAPAPAAEQRH